MVEYRLAKARSRFEHEIEKSHPSDDSFFYLIESTSGSVVEYRLAKARVAGSNLSVLHEIEKSHPSDDSFFYLIESTSGSVVEYRLAKARVAVRL